MKFTLWVRALRTVIELLATRLGVLLLLSAASLRRRRAYPDAPPVAHSQRVQLRNLG